MKMDTLHELYVEELKDLYDAEKQLVAALPKMAKAASHSELRQAFENHLEQTKEHAARLEMILGELEELGRVKKCKGMQGLIEEGKELLEEDVEEDVLDAGLISKAQHVEHYEIAGYGTARAYAELMGHRDHADLLQKTLDEEGETDKLLTAIAMRSVNIEANEGTGMGDEGEEEEETSRSRARSGSRASGKANGRSRTAGSTRTTTRRRRTTKSRR